MKRINSSAVIIFSPHSSSSKRYSKEATVPGVKSKAMVASDPLRNLHGGSVQSLTRTSSREAVPKLPSLGPKISIVTAKVGSQSVHIIVPYPHTYDPESSLLSYHGSKGYIFIHAFNFGICSGAHNWICSACATIPAIACVSQLVLMVKE